MKKLIETAKRIATEHEALPFAVYSSMQEQCILNVPVIKPLLIFVLSGRKALGEEGELECPSGSFIFLSNSPDVAMRNIPAESDYFALLVEFSYSDFSCFHPQGRRESSSFQGIIDPTLEATLQQFVEWSEFSPDTLWHVRRQELLQLLYHLGHHQVASIVEPPTLSHQVHSILCENLAHPLAASELAARLAMSESTLRRKLGVEGTSFQSLRDRAALGFGLHLIQSTFEPIGFIAERCGYSSQSRFTEKFKQLFHVTPTALRKTRMRESGE